MVSAVPAHPLRYDPSMESPEPGERETAEELTRTMLGISETTFRTGGHALRSVHAKSAGLLRGEFRVLDGLPAPLAQGLFARPAAYPVVMRFSTIPGDIIDDSISTPRGLALKVVGVEGERLPGSEGERTQDFVLVDAPAFSAPDAASFLSSLKLLAATTDTPQILKKAVSAVTSRAEAALEAAGTKSAQLSTMGGHPPTHILGSTYYSQAPLLHGEYVAKIAVAPISANLTGLAGKEVDLSAGPNAHRASIVAHFEREGGEWEVRVQLCTDLRRMPIEDASVEWPADESPYLPVARIVVPPQRGWSVTRSSAVDDGFSFSPWHGLAAHRPLGSIMRTRKLAYEMSARFRAEHNGRRVAEPKRLPEFPD